MQSPVEPLISSLTPFAHTVTVSFPLVEDQSVLLLAWTTTPWTLPSNLALCVHPNQDYVKGA